MTKVYSKALDQSLEIDRNIGEIHGSSGGPTVIFFAGIHGNEPAGIFALKQVLEEIENQQLELNGSLYAIAGNLWALEMGKRYDKADLNRLWSDLRVQQLENSNLGIDNNDTEQQIELYSELKQIMEKEQGPYYFMDLHTTSAPTIPFLTVNDSLLNRKFTELYPCPMILGIEEYLSGPLLSYINELGFVSFGFEGGQHDELVSITNHRSFIYLSLVFTGLLPKEATDFDAHYKQIEQASEKNSGVYEINYRFALAEEDDFVMRPGFENFQSVQKGELLATVNGKKVLAAYSSSIFMPLYQKEGNEGFFSIRLVHPFFLKLSEFLRKKRLDRLLPYLPGVHWTSSKRDALMLNKRIAKFLAKEIMHLMGYRSRYFDKKYLHVKNREAASKYKQYRHEKWYSKVF